MAAMAISGDRARVAFSTSKTPFNTVRTMVVEFYGARDMVDLKASWPSSIELGPNEAPVTFADSLSRVQHEPDCAAQMATHRASTHSTRAFCDCMTDQELDKQCILELQSRELVVPAFLQLLSYVQAYSVSILDPDDSEIWQVVYRYDFLANFYSGINFSPKSHPVPSPSLPLIERDEWQKKRSENNFQISEMISEENWGALVDTFKRQTRGHYFCDFAYPSEFTKCLDETGHIFAGFRYSKDHPRKVVIRMDHYIDCTIQGLLKVMSEVQMTKTWVPYFRFPFHVGLQDCYPIATLGRLEKVSMYKVDLPWPVTNREAVLHGWLVDDLDHNDKLVICFRGLDLDYPVNPCVQPVDVPKTDAKAIRIYVEGGCRLTMLKEDKILMEMMWNLDMKFDVPVSLVKFVTKNFIKAGLNSLGEICRKAETDGHWTDFEKRNPWLYGFVKQRLASHPPLDISPPLRNGSSSNNKSSSRLRRTAEEKEKNTSKLRSLRAAFGRERQKI